VFDMVESNFSTEETIAEVQRVMLSATRNSKRFSPKRTIGASVELRCVAAAEDAGGFQNRRFPCPFRGQRKLNPARKFDPERFEAAKIPQLQISEHEER